MADEIDDIDEIEFEKETAATRHKELKGALRGLATAISQKNDTKVAEAIKESANASQAVAEAIKNIPQPKSPDVKVQISQQEIVTSLEAICKRIEESNKTVVDALENKLMVDSFEFTMDYGNYKTAKVNYKPMSQISISKPKYQA